MTMTDRVRLTGHIPGRSVAVVRALGHDLLDLLLGQLGMRLGGMRPHLLEQLRVVIGLQVAVAHGAVNLS